MNDTSQANKRIAKNTLVIYGQLILRMFLGLLTSRLALEALGVSDFGLYSVVGGVIALFTFISSSLSGTTIRFINVERGKANGDLNLIFNVCNVLHILMAIFLFLLFEIGGVYYIHHFLNVEVGREADAMFVFQVSVVTCCLGIINVPFSSLFNASEKFLFTSVVGIAVKIAELILLFWLLTYNGNRLKAYAIIETLFTMTPFVIYHYYAYHRWVEVVRWRFVRNKKLYKEVFVFSSYNLMSTFAKMTRGQGSPLLINYFFGTVVNGSFAVARVVQRNIWPLCSSIQSAATPQITQSYSGGNMERVFYLVGRICKYSIFMMMLAFFPLWAEIDFILHVWLIKVPEGASIFCQWALLIEFVSVTDGGIRDVVNASGRVSSFRIVYSILMISCIPIAFVLYKSGSPAYMLLVVFLIADIIWRIAQLYLVNYILRFPIFKFCRMAYFPVLKSCLPILICLFFTSRIQIESSLGHIGHIVLIFLLTAFSVLYIGLSKHERDKIYIQFVHRIKSSFYSPK